MDMRWSFFQTWNKALESKKEKPVRPRNRIWASEIGGAYIDRYLKMKGVEPSNPYTSRVLRKFEAGKLMEWVVQMVLVRAGVFVKTQEWIPYQYPGLLEVTGKLDFLAGGKIDWEKAEYEVKQLNLPEFFDRATSAIIKHLSKKYPEGLNEIILEVKSCSSYMFEKYLNTGADTRHEMQTLHYLIAKDMDESHLVYISKDDLRMLELGVFRTPKLEKRYRADIEAMSNFYFRNIEPPKEKEIIIENGRFQANWKVGYSTYLTMLYGYKNQGEFDAKYKGKVASWNRTVKRVAEGKRMTDLNRKFLEEIEKEFPDYRKELGLVAKEGTK